MAAIRTTSERRLARMLVLAFVALALAALSLVLATEAAFGAGLPYFFSHL